MFSKQHWADNIPNSAGHDQQWIEWFSWNKEKNEVSFTANIFLLQFLNTFDIWTQGDRQSYQAYSSEALQRF